MLAFPGEGESKDNILHDALAQGKECCTVALRNWNAVQASPSAARYEEFDIQGGEVHVHGDDRSTEFGAKRKSRGS